MTLAPHEPSVGAAATADEAVGVSDHAVPAAEVVEHVLFLGALLWLLWPATVAEGARDAGSAAFLAVALLLALLATRPWQRLASRAWLVAPATAMAAILVVPATGVGRSGAVAALAYGLGAGFLMATVAYARTPARRIAVAASLCVGGVAQFAWALVPWWGAGDPSHPMVGTYYWHNQLAVALLVPSLLGLALAVSARRPWRAAGWVAAPVSAAGVVLSTSRATLLCLVVGWLLIVGYAFVTAPHRRATAVRALVVTLLSVGVSLALPGPPLFTSWVSPLGGTAARSASGETLDANTVYRTQFWRESAAVFSAHPLAGVGYGRISHQADGLVPKTWARSPLAHNGVLQALAEGGVLLGLPLLVGLELIVIGLVRRMRRLLPGRAVPRGPDQVLVVAASLTALALLAHSLVDIDWTYPGLLAQFAVVVGLALGAGRADIDTTDPVTSRVAVVATALLALALACGAAVAWNQAFHIIDGFSITGGASS